MVNESFAGPHDYENSISFYDMTTGMIREGSDQGWLKEFATNYTTSLIFAAPLAAGAIYEQTNAGAWANH